MKTNIRSLFLSLLLVSFCSLATSAVFGNPPFDVAKSKSNANDTGPGDKVPGTETGHRRIVTEKAKTAVWIFVYGTGVCSADDHAKKIADLEGGEKQWKIEAEKLVWFRLDNGDYTIKDGKICDKEGKSLVAKRFLRNLDIDLKRGKIILASGVVKHERKLPPLLFEPSDGTTQAAESDSSSGKRSRLVKEAFYGSTTDRLKLEKWLRCKFHRLRNKPGRQNQLLDAINTLDSSLAKAVEEHVKGIEDDQDRSSKKRRINNMQAQARPFKKWLAEQTATKANQTPDVGHPLQVESSDTSTGATKSSGVAIVKPTSPPIPSRTGEGSTLAPSQSAGTAEVGSNPPPPRISAAPKATAGVADANQNREVGHRLQEINTTLRQCGEQLDSMPSKGKPIPPIEVLDIGHKLLRIGRELSYLEREAKISSKEHYNLHESCKVWLFRYAEKAGMPRSSISELFSTQKSSFEPGLIGRLPELKKLLQEVEMQLHQARVRGNPSPPVEPIKPLLPHDAALGRVKDRASQPVEPTKPPLPVQPKAPYNIGNPIKR